MSADELAAERFAIPSYLIDTPELCAQRQRVLIEAEDYLAAQRRLAEQERRLVRRG